MSNGQQSILEKYWLGILQRLQAEVLSFNQLVNHRGEQGRENEQSLSRILERLIPQKYGVGTGLVIDRNGEYSRQMDIVVYDNSDEPTLMAQTNQVLFPIENVMLCIEVKTTIDKDEIDNAYEKMHSLIRLETNNQPPSFGLVGYKSSIGADTVAKHITSVNSMARPSTFDYCFVLELGLVGTMLQHTEERPTSSILTGIAPLHDTSSGLRVAGNCVTVADDYPEHEFKVGRQTYPVVSVGALSVAADPARALLIFCEAMLADLASRAGRESVMRRYMTDLTRDLLPLDKQGFHS
jgi:hypothetical protein